MKNLIIATSLAMTSFAALADGSGHLDWLDKASKPTRAERHAALAGGSHAQGGVTQVAQATEASRKHTTAAPMDNCGRFGNLLSWEGVTIPYGAES